MYLKEILLYSFLQVVGFWPRKTVVLSSQTYILCSFCCDWKKKEFSKKHTTEHQHFQNFVHIFCSLFILIIDKTVLTLLISTAILLKERRSTQNVVL